MVIAPDDCSLINRCISYTPVTFSLWWSSSALCSFFSKAGQRSCGSFFSALERLLVSKHEPSTASPRSNQWASLQLFSAESRVGHSHWVISRRRCFLSASVTDVYITITLHYITLLICLLLLGFSYCLWFG